MNINTGNNLKDQDMVEKVMSGDTQAFGSIIKNTERLVAQIVFKMIPRAEDRKDLAQDIYLKVYNKLSGFKFQSKLSTWIAQISYNTCLDYLRKKKLILHGDDHEGSEPQDNMLDKINKESRNITSSDVSNFIQRKELSAILKTEIEKLPPDFKTLVTLYHTEELSYEEIEQITGLPSGTVKSYLFRARKILRDNLLLNYKKEDL